MGSAGVFPFPKLSPGGGGTATALSGQGGGGAAGGWRREKLAQQSLRRGVRPEDRERWICFAVEGGTPAGKRSSFRLASRRSAGKKERRGKRLGESFGNVMWRQMCWSGNLVARLEGKK